jgi:hypothetical protein
MSFLIKHTNGDLFLKINLDLARWEEYFDMTAQDYLEFAVSQQEGEGLEPGDKLMIPCYDFKSQESMRSRLYYLRGQMAKLQPGIAKTIAIFRETINERGEKKFFIVLQKRGTGTDAGAVIVRKSGRIESLEGEEVSLSELGWNQASSDLEKKEGEQKQEEEQEEENEGEEKDYKRVIEIAVQDGYTLPDLLKEIGMTVRDKEFPIIQALYMESIRKLSEKMFQGQNQGEVESTEEANFAIPESIDKEVEEND